MAEREGRLPFKLIEQDHGEALTSYGGLPCVIALMAAGGDCSEDIEWLRSDAGLKLLVGELPSAEAVRFFLYGFQTSDCWREGQSRELLLPRG